MLGLTLWLETQGQLFSPRSGPAPVVGLADFFPASLVPLTSELLLALALPVVGLGILAKHYLPVISGVTWFKFGCLLLLLVLLLLPLSFLKQNGLWSLVLLTSLFLFLLQVLSEGTAFVEKYRHHGDLWLLPLLYLVWPLLGSTP